MNLGKLYLDSAIRQMTLCKQLAEKTFEQISDAQFHYCPSKESNSIAVLIQHISGNMISRWTNFLTEDGEKPWRERDKEFETEQQAIPYLLKRWEKGWECMFSVLNGLTEEDLTKIVTIRNQEMSAIDAINRHLSHYANHVGQIIYVGKMLKDQDWITLSIPKKRTNA